MNINRLYTTIDAHAGGEPMRIITGGIPPNRGETMLAQRAYIREHADHVRRVLMHEPRGHRGMYGCVVVPPVSPDADFGVLFLRDKGCSSMCGHGIIAVVTALIETGYFPVTEATPRIVIDSPAGTIIARARLEGGEVQSVSFENVPSFAYALDVPLTIDGVSFPVDIAFAGAFYAIVEANALGVRAEIDQLAALQTWGRAIKERIESMMSVQHPYEPQFQGIYGRDRHR